jgi:hypothetical protein
VLGPPTTSFKKESRPPAVFFTKTAGGLL